VISLALPNRKTLGKWVVALIILNEIRGLCVVATVAYGWWIGTRP
jgi:hypothetical protein